MKWLDLLYRTSNMSRIGTLSLVSLIVLWLFSLVIPTYAPAPPEAQVMGMNGKHFKYGDELFLRYYVQSIKSNDGYLCLGTSESTTLKNGNYYDFLNADEGIQSRFTSLAGAGRTAGIHMTWMDKVRDDLDSLKVFYFINPVYWREDLCRLDREYWTRYCNYTLLESDDSAIADLMDQAGARDHREQTTLAERLSYSTENAIREWRTSFSQDLKYMVNPSAFTEALRLSTSLEPIVPDLQSLENFELDSAYNVEKRYSNHEWFRPISRDTSYRWQELRAFIKFCDKTNIDVSFIIGPYNHHFIEKYQPSALEGYVELNRKLATFLEDEGAEFVDCSGFSGTIGAHKDLQHHSSFGAYLIYDRIARYINEKDH